MSNAGAANNANRMVTARVINALFQPDIFIPIIRIKSSRMGITDTNAAIGVLVRFVLFSLGTDNDSVKICGQI